MKVRIALVTGLLLASFGSVSQAAEHARGAHDQDRVAKHTIVKKSQHGKRVVKNIRVVKKASPRHVAKVTRQKARSKQVSWKKIVQKKRSKNINNKAKRKFYTVKPGDSIYKVSRKTGVQANKIIRLNRTQLSAKNGYGLKIGQKLRLRRS